MKKFFILLISIFLFSCKNHSGNKFSKLEKAGWLLGKWEKKLPTGKLVETWENNNDSIYTGKSYFIISKDTIHSENLTLAQVKNELILSSATIGQNNDEPIFFNLTSEEENHFIFENPKNNYPKKIEYKKINDTNISVKISGTQQEKTINENYILTQKKI